MLPGAAAPYDWRVSEPASPLPLLLDSLREAALIVGGDCVIFANAAARDLLGEDIEGASLAELIAHPAAIQVLARPSP